jgi:hypothetical protein
MPTEVFQERVEDERAWTADSIGQDRPWFLHLDQKCWDLIDPVVESWRQDLLPVTEVRLNEAQRQAGTEVLADVIGMLESGYGFVLLDRIPLDRYSHEEAKLAYWLIGQFIGQPFEQNVKGTSLYDVRDAGGDLTKGSRFSITNERTSFHTDGSFNQIIADHVGLLCLFTAKSGGESQMMSAYSLHNRLMERHSDLLKVLYQPFHVDRRGEFEEGELPASEQPIFHWDGHELTMRYLNYYIQVGHQEMELPLSDAQRKALDAIEELLKEEDLFVEFSVEPGQMLFCNNHWILHNRNAYEDYGDPELRRHYVRLWLLRSGRVS